MNLDQMTTEDLFNLYMDSMATQHKLIELGQKTNYKLADECFLVIKSRMLRKRVNVLVVNNQRYYPDDRYLCLLPEKTATPEQLDKDLLFMPSEDLDEVMEAVQ